MLARLHHISSRLGVGSHSLHIAQWRHFRRKHALAIRQCHSRLSSAASARQRWGQRIGTQSADILRDRRLASGRLCTSDLEEQDRRRRRVSSENNRPVHECICSQPGEGTEIEEEDLQREAFDQGRYVHLNPPRGWSLPRQGQDVVLCQAHWGRVHPDHFTRYYSALLGSSASPTLASS